MEAATAAIRLVIVIDQVLVVGIGVNGFHMPRDNPELVVHRLVRAEPLAGMGFAHINNHEFDVGEFGGQVGRHARQLLLGELKVGQGSAKLLAFLGVGEGLIEATGSTSTLKKIRSPFWATG